MGKARGTVNTNSRNANTSQEKEKVCTLALLFVIPHKEKPVCVCVYFKSGLYDFAFKLCEHSDLQWFEVCNLWFS